MPASTRHLQRPLGVFLPIDVSEIHRVDRFRKGEVHNLKELMKKSRELGMQTFDQALFDLYSAGEITYEDALKHADAPNDLRLMIKLGNTNDSRYLDQATRGLSLQNSDN